MEATTLKTDFFGEGTIKTIFETYDIDGHGFLPSNLIGDLVRACGKNPSTHQVEQINKTLEEQKKNNFDVDTLKNILANLKGVGDDPQAVIRALSIFDRNDSGWVSMSEIRTALGSLGEKVDVEAIDLILKETRTDDVGSFCIEEFVTLLFDTIANKK